MAYKRIPLAAGTTIEGGNGKYTIIDNDTPRTPIFKSGSSTLVYLVAFEGNAASDIDGTIFLLKEVYPTKEKPIGALTRGGNGRTLVEVIEGSGGLSILKQHIQRIRKEVRISQNKACGDDLISYKFDAFYEEERYYTVDVYKSNAQTLDTYMAANKIFGHVKPALLIGQHLCEALNVFHNGEAPYLHLDIKPDNILTTTIPGADNFPILRLIDFNSAHQLDSNGQIKDLDLDEIRASITSNKGFSPQEVIHKDTQGHLINKASDVYSIAAVIYWAVFNDYLGHTDSKNNRSPSHSIVAPDDPRFIDFSHFFVEALNNFFIHFTDRHPDTIKQWSRYTIEALRTAIGKLLQQCDLELHHILIHELKTAKENACKIHLIERVKKNPPEYSAEYSKENEIRRKIKMWPTGLIPKELYETLPLRWRALTNLQWMSYSLLVLFYFNLFVLLRPPILSNIPLIIGLAILYFVYSRMCAHFFWESKKSVNYRDCLGYVVAKWAFLLFLIAAGLKLYMLEIYIFYDLWLSLSWPGDMAIYLITGFGILHIIFLSLSRWGIGRANKILLNNDYQREIDSLISQSVLSELKAQLPEAYTDIFVIQRLIDVAEENEFIRIDEAVSAYRLTLQ